MPLVVDASEPFDLAGDRFSDRDNTTGLPRHLLEPMFLRRAFRTADEVGAVGAAFAVVRITARIYNGRPREVTGDGRSAAVTDFVLATNFGGIASDDQIGSDEGWWRVELPQRPARAVWLVTGQPYAVKSTFGRVHHYEVPVRRVDG